MIKKIKFTKMVASGNDFVVTEVKSQKSKVKSLNYFAKKICDRKYGVGADGLLALEKSKVADIRMRIFNADGSEANMCGNGARCVAKYIEDKRPKTRDQRLIETKAGIIKALINTNSVKINLTSPKDLKLNISISIMGRAIRVNFINTGVPHAIIFVEGLDKIDVVNLGRQVRFHKKFAPAGTNVDFVEVLGNNVIKIRTYERGVEDETLACGTGSTAAALITNLVISHKSKVISQKSEVISQKINVETKSSEILKVYFNRKEDKFSDVWLEGKARRVYEGEYNV